MRKNLFAGESGSLYLFALCGISILGSIFSYILVGRTGSFAGMSIANWVSYAVTQVAIVLVVWFFSMWRRYDVFAVAKIRPMKDARRWLLLFPITVFTIIAFLPVSMLFQEFFNLIGFRGGVSAGTIEFDNAGVFFLAVFVIALLPALGEEFLMRGNVLPGLASRGAVFGVFISALLFSLMHANPVQTGYQFCIGVVLAVLFMLSGSLVPCVAVHFFNNFLSLLMTAYIPEIDAAIAGLGAFNWLTGTVSFVVGTLVLVLLLYAYYRLGQPKKEKEGFKVVQGGVVFEEYSLYAYEDNPAPAKKGGAAAEGIKNAFRFVGSLFTAQGWKKVERELFLCCGDVRYVGKSQPMFGLWIAIGLAVAYWGLALVMGLAV